MTSDEQEAESRKYGPGIRHMLRLRSGNVAVFNDSRTLLGIVPVTETLELVPYVEPVPPKIRALVFDMGGICDLGPLDMDELHNTLSNLLGD